MDIKQFTGLSIIGIGIYMVISIVLEEQGTYMGTFDMLAGLYMWLIGGIAAYLLLKR